MKRIATASLLCLALAACSTTGDDKSSTLGNGGGTVTAAPPAVTPTGPTTPQAALLEAGDRVFFGYDRYDLTPEATSVLDRQAAWLAAYPTVTVVVEGHSDERGTREYNLALGDRRAAAARNYLVAKGVDAARIRTISYGKERPAVGGADEAAWAQNRRAATVIDG